MATTFYPALDSIVDLDVLPEQLSFVKDGAADLLSKLFFKDLQYSKSPRGDAAHYSLKLVSLRRIELTLPGSGFALVLNPSVAAPGDPAQFVSEIPIAIDWQWPILAYLHAFRSEGFSFDGGAFYDLAVQVFNLPGERLVEEAFAVFFPGPAADAARLFVDAVNAHPAYENLQYPSPTGNAAAEVAAAISTTLGQTPARVIFEVFVFDGGDDSASLEKVAELFGRAVGGNAVEHLKKILIPKIDATLQLAAAIEFPREVLVPLDAGGQPDPDPASKSLLVFTTAGASFRFSTESGFGYSDELEATLTPSQIGNTGLAITIEKAKLDLSRDRNIPEADQDGRPPDFVGVFITKATVTLPPFLEQDPGGSTAQIHAENLLIGTGGISGTLGLRAIDPLDTAPALVKASLGGGFELGFSGFDLSFQQNRITGSNIRGFLKVPGFEDTEGNPAQIDIVAHIDPNGDFSVTASEAQGIRALRIPDVLEVIVKSVAVGRKGGRFFLAIAGELDFAEQGPPIGQFVPDKLEVQKLIVWDDGALEFEGGKLTLPQAITLSIGPAKLSVTAIGLGSHEQEHRGVLRQYSYFTFDGGISVSPGGVDVSGKGIAFYYTKGNNDLPPADPAARPLDVFMRLQSIAVDIVLPGNATAEKAAVLIKGFLSLQEATPPAAGTEYIGGVDLTLPKLKMAGSAAMRLNPALPAFLIDAGLELSSPILLAQTGLGIYGFRGLLGMRYVASRQQIGLTDQDPWWQYYKKKVAPDNKEGVQVSKFAQRDGFSLGAGVSLATAFDAGQTFSSKIFFLLSLPEVFLLEGQGQVLKQRIGLDTTQDPPFFALLSISSVAVEAAFGVNYKIPDEGNQQGAIATLNGTLEMGYYFADSSAWYLNVGKDEPENRRIMTRLLKVFDVYFYLMLSSSGIRAGAGNAYELKKKWGPLKADLSAYLDVSARLSRRPKQIGGSIQLGGSVELSIFGCGFGLSGEASLVAEGIKPFMIAGSLKVCVKIWWKRYCGTFDFNYTFDPSLNLDEIPVLPADLRQAGKALNMHTGETFPLWTGTALPAVAALAGVMVPMDSYIDLELAKSVKIAQPVKDRFGGSLQGSKYLEYFPPQRAKSDRVRHEYSLEKVEILYHDGGGWVPYDIYAAATPLALAPFVTADLATLQHGWWQNQEPAEQRKLRIMARSPLGYLSQGTGDVVPEDLGITVETIFCAPEGKEKICLPIDGFRPQEQPPIVLPRNVFHFHQLLRFRVTGGDGRIVQRPAPPSKRAIEAEAGEAIELYFLESFPTVTLHLAICSETAEVSYYERTLAPVADGYRDLPRYMYRLLETRQLAPSSGVVEIEYDELSRPVDKIVIRTGSCKKEEPRGCEPHRTFPKLLFTFLRTLIRKGHLPGPEIELSPEHYPTYKGVFFETDLYTNEGRPNPRYSVAAAAPARLRAEITDDQGFRCFLELEIDPAVGGVDWKQVEDLLSLEAQPDSGDVLLFKAEIVAVVGGQRQPVRITGRSCYPMSTCPAKPPSLGNIGAFLNELAAANRLARPAGTLRGGETLSFAAMAGLAEPPPAVRLVGESEADKELRAFIHLGESAETELRIGRPAAGPQDVLPFGQIRGFADLRLLEADSDRLLLAAEAIPAPGGALFEPGARALAAIPVEIALSGKWIRDLGGLPPASPAASSPCGEGSRCSVLLYSVCVVRYLDAVENETQGTQEQVSEEVRTMIEAFNGSLQPIWRPYTHFAVRLETRDQLFRENGGSPERDYPRSQVFAFRTTGPLGHFHSYIGPGGVQVERPDYAALKQKDRQDEFKLKDFLHYVDFARSYPNADGQLLGAKPLFYTDPELRLFFLKPYVYEMVRGWGDLPGSDGTDLRLTVAVKDPAPDPSAPPGTPAEIEWEIDPTPIVSSEVRVINNMIIYGTPCAEVTVISERAVYGTVSLPDLLPQKLYTAIYTLGLKRNDAPESSRVLREVLRHPFQTSRYASFEEQVDSWRLKTSGPVVQRAAVFPLDFTAAPETPALAAQVLAGTLPGEHPLHQDFGDRFDRLMQGVFGIAGLPPAATTEFDLVRERLSGRVYGILIRSPEPFNDPKMPEAALAGTLTASIGGSPASAYRALFSKDRSQAFLSDAAGALDLPPGTSGVFTFVFKQWDGSGYAAVSTVVTPAITLG